ncbi:PREDICTED: protein TBRG4 isoform X2 [Odobenus rosmarus divergens]|uniref:FAST kinase domain-containing protein 4 n=1 Tax=Odobenus rosmarus divergens TaxID=9708 RepID=A0A2U3WX22_ODORO|nr:PREDICTED: protein TBRG4 isoform X2 [Odobenus rosmarus divergens]
MAARLVKWCACLLREASLVAPAVAPVGRLRFTQVTPRTLTSSATSRSSHFPGSLSGLLEKEQVFATRPEQQEVDQLIQKATRPEELLELLNGGHCLQENHAALMLIQLSRLLSDKPEYKASLMQDARFQQLLQLVNGQIASVWHGPLVRLLRSLYALALPAACKELQSVEQEVRWRMRRLRYKHLAFLAESSATYMQERGSQELLAELLVHLERRWAEIEDGRMVVAMMAKTGPLSEPLMNRLEDKHVLDRAQTIPVPHLCNVLLAFAHLNFHPEREDQFFSLVHEKLGSALTGLHPALQVDVVWALCVLQQVQEAELQAVLRPDLHTHFLEGGSPKDQSTFQKLLHINASAQLEHPEYTGPHLPASALVPRLSALDRKVTPLQKELQDTLKGLLGGSSRGSFMVPTQYGWVLDAEVLLDSESQFLPPRDFVAPHLAPPSGSQPLPPGAKRLAFLRWEFPNYGSRSRDLLGRFALARRHVQAAGFLVVDVPYYEWLELRSEWQKGAYLKDKMRKAVAEELAK